MLADVLSNAITNPRMRAGGFADGLGQRNCSAGALVPGLVLVVFYLIYLFIPRPGPAGADAPTGVPEGGGRPVSVHAACCYCPDLPGPLRLIDAGAGVILGEYRIRQAAAVGAVGAIPAWR